MTDNYVQYKEGYKYITCRDHVYQTKIRGYQAESDFLRLTEDGKLHIRKGYAYDGASGALDTPSNMRGSLIHDALCQLQREGRLPDSVIPDIDQEYFRVCREDGMPLIRAALHYAVLRVYDWTKDEKKVKIAPRKAHIGEIIA